MQPEAWREAQECLQRAERDLAASRTLLLAAEPLTDIVVYHAQQAAEKARKAFLAAHDQPLSRTHELVPLLDACRKLDLAFEQFLSACQVLSPYSTRFRYPPGPLAPPTEEAERALGLATDLFHFVRDQLLL